MRAIYSPAQPTDNYLVIEGDPHHHLAKVVRIQLGEELLVINGNGQGYRGWVDQIERKSTTILLKEQFSKERNYSIDLFLCLVKKDALESSVRFASELGLREIQLIESEFSQRIKPNYERLEAISISALEQSNSFYLTITEKIKKLVEIVSKAEKYEQIFYFSSIPQAQAEPITLERNKSYAYIIGPEGGLSEAEEKILNGIQNLRLVHLSTPILRTPTAVSVAAGYLLGRLT